MFDIGGGELLLILMGVLVLFGPKKLPELAQGLGKGLRQFRKAQQDFSEQINTALYDDQRKENASKAPPAATNTVARNQQSISAPSGNPAPELPEHTSSDENAAVKGERDEEPEKRIAPPARPQEEINKEKGEEPTA